MPDRRQALIDMSTTLHDQLAVLRALNIPRDRNLSMAMHRLNDAIELVESAAGFDHFAQLAAA